MNINTSNLKRLDFKLAAAIFIIASAGLLSLLSTQQDLFYRQLVMMAVGATIVVLIASFEWRPFINYPAIIWGIYFFSISLLIFVNLFSEPIRGARGWINFGLFEFQPAELAKLALIIFYASFFSKGHVQIARASRLLSSFVYFAVPAALVAAQPDMGSAIVLFAIWFGFLIVSGIKWKHIAISAVLFVALGSIIWTGFLYDYQKERITGFLNPGQDLLGINYNVAQSKTAIGSAGLFGKGFGQGTQTHLGFLPEAQTDFIFAAFIEEWGLLGGLVLLAAFMIMVFRVLAIGLISSDNFSRFICLGAAMLFLTQFLLNVGSNIGLTPVTGVTFPFLSYGGSSLLTNFILVGIIQSIAVRR